MDFDTYERWLKDQLAHLTLPADITRQHGPTITINALPVKSFWSLEWYLFFSDSQYVRLKEEFTPKRGGGSRRNHFSFHYGPLPAALDKDGLPKFRPPDPVELRVDLLRGDAHLHFKAPLPHYDQDKVQGMIIEKLDMFDFLRAVLQQRSLSVELSHLLGFTIRERKA